MCKHFYSSMIIFSLKAATDVVKMKFSHFVVIFYIFTADIFSANCHCANQEQNKILRFFSDPKCVLNIEKIKTGFNLIKTQLRRDFEENKNDLGNSEIKMEEEDTSTNIVKRENYEKELESDLTTITDYYEETTPNVSKDYLDIGIQTLLRAPVKCKNGLKIVGGRCREIY